MNIVAVIGAGASGMLAALTAAEKSDNRVLLLERQARAGRKLMSTGNGRCNLTNMNAASAAYHDAPASFTAPAMSAFPPREVRAYFRSIGLLTVEEPDGRVYPLSNSANSVVDVLRYALEAAGVELLDARQVRGIKRKGLGFVLKTDEDEIKADDVIVACGGVAGEKLGGVPDGYELLESMGHTRTPLYPALVQIVTDPEYPRSLKGIKADAGLALMRGGVCSGESAGEILFTDNGVSGPAAFDLSRAVSTAGKAEMTLVLDFLRGYDSGEVYNLLGERIKAAPELAAGELLTGTVHNRLGRMIVKYAGIDAAKKLCELDDAERHRLTAVVKNFTLTVRGTEGFSLAQVTVGGVDTSEFNADTLCSRMVPHLFACGEVLDVDGDCGGYNLQWAWASGRLAGRLGG